MAADHWIRFEGYEGRLDPDYRGAYAAAGLRFPYVGRNRRWDIVRVAGEPAGSVYPLGSYTVLSRGHDMMRKAHEEAAAYRLHFKACAGVGACQDIGHPGGPRRSMREATGLRIPSPSATPLATEAGEEEPEPRPEPAAGTLDVAEPVAAATVVDAADARGRDADWIAALRPVGQVGRRRISETVDLTVVPLRFSLWPGPPLGMREDCNKRGGRVIGDAGDLSCAEVEIVKRLRAGGWDAWWVQAFRCGRARWHAFISDGAELSDAVRHLQATAGSGVGHPDVIAWRDDRVVAIESKGPGDALRPSQIEWFSRALEAGILPSDIGVVEWRVDVAPRTFG